MRRALSLLLAVLAMLAPAASAIAAPMRDAGRVELSSENRVKEIFASDASKPEGHTLFLQRDPNGYQDSVNLYAYGANDPIDHRDPTGSECIDCQNFNDPSVRALSSEDQEMLEWAMSDAARSYVTGLLLQQWKDSAEQKIDAGLANLTLGVRQFMPVTPSSAATCPVLPDQLRAAGGTGLILAGSGEIAEGIVEHPYTVAAGLGLDAAAWAGERTCLTVTAWAARRTAFAKRAARMGLTPLEYEVQMAFSAKAKAGMRIVNLGHPGVLAEAASRLGVRLDDITIADGVARVSINFTHTVSPSSLTVLGEHLAAKGARSVVLNTGAVTNPLILSRLQYAAMNQKQFLGATVRLVDPRNGAFQLLFDLTK